MPVTIKVNGTTLSLVHKFSTGITTATLPDVCKTPSPGGPVPVPYPNIANSITLSDGTTTVKGDKAMAANKGSGFSLSNGDNAGVAGGVKSSTFMKEATWILYSFDVKMDGKNACRLGDKMFHNAENAANLSGCLNPPIAVPDFEAILQECMNKAADDWEARNGPTDYKQFCKSPGARKRRGDEIGEDASACVAAAMESQGRSNQVALDQSFRNTAGGGPGAIQAVGSPGQVVANTVRPDVVLHAPGPLSGVAAARAVYDFKAPCPPGSNNPSWSGNQGADYLATFRVVARLVSPHNAMIAGAASSALRVAAQLLNIRLPFL
ncbi:MULTISPECIES: DUF4150 domain-containing protein [unclassified Variovorax]|uniref:DUF4150 domain-containing protein n=1 Tax=unclassified Variovorax TaxID=663243 RepID=UPI003F476445